MERREHYDPEDIEQLLMERGFDELLEEERAYVLRHLSGRDEYEAMRRLLHHVQRSEPEPDLLEADPHVRDHVMQVFRDQRKPQWRIWLNSVSAFLMPEEASAMWRPALALAGLAVAITAGVWLFRSGGPDATQLAEVRPVDKQEPAPSAPEGKPIDAATPQAEALEPAEAPVRMPAMLGEPATAASATDDEQVLQEAVAEERMSDPAKDAIASGTTFHADAATEDLKAITLSSTAVKPVADSFAFQYTSPAATNSGYLDNWSLANAQGTVARQVEAVREKKASSAKRKAEDDQHDASRSLANDQAALALLSAAW